MGLVVAFVAGGLEHEMANPGFWCRLLFPCLDCGKDVGVFDENVDHGRVFEVLTKAANSNAVAAMTCDLRSCKLCGSSIKEGGLRFGQ